MAAGGARGGADGGVLRVAGRDVRLTHPGKELWPAQGSAPAVTKADLVAALAALAPALLGQVAGRPLTRVRWPHGVGGQRFLEKNAPAGAPDWLRTARVGGVVHPVVDDLAGLVWAAQLGALELHVPQWRVDAAGRPLPPDRLVVDLDPGPGTGLAECAALAHRVAERLADDGLTAVPVTSGSSGLHLYAALAGTQSADVVRAHARRLAHSLARDAPGVTATMTRSDRIGRVLIDWSQNSASKTTAAPCSPRGLPGAPAAAPRRWDEVDSRLTQLGLAELVARADVSAELLAPLAPGAPRGPRVPERD